jgi:hypothetical protein
MADEFVAKIEEELRKPAHDRNADLIAFWREQLEILRQGMN